VRLLLDANSFLWWVAGSPRLSATAREAIGSGDNEILMTIGSLWEITIKRALGKLQFPHEFETVLRDEGFELLPVTYTHLRALESLPLHHRDPFDRLLIAQSIAEDIAVATNDPKFALYDVKTLW
jgi:PIN domain nuclease of toxin-antitoxin system